MNAKEAREIAMKSTVYLNAIIEAIKEKAENGEFELDLYGYLSYIDGGGYYSKSFKYRDTELKQLKDLGYRVEITYRKKQLFRQRIVEEFHTIYW